MWGRELLSRRQIRAVDLGEIDDELVVNVKGGRSSQPQWVSCRDNRCGWDVGVDGESGCGNR